LNTKETKLPAVQAGQVWRTIRGFILWSHERGTIQYDVMVTLILLFVFLSPRFINFNDRPVQQPAFFWRRRISRWKWRIRLSG